MHAPHLRTQRIASVADGAAVSASTIDTAAQREARRDARRTLLVQTSPWGTLR